MGGAWGPPVLAGSEVILSKHVQEGPSAGPPPEHVRSSFGGEGCVNQESLLSAVCFRRRGQQKSPDFLCSRPHSMCLRPERTLRWEAGVPRGAFSRERPPEQATQGGLGLGHPCLRRWAAGACGWKVGCQGQRPGAELPASDEPAAQRPAQPTATAHDGPSPGPSDRCPQPPAFSPELDTENQKGPLLWALAGLDRAHGSSEAHEGRDHAGSLVATCVGEPLVGSPECSCEPAASPSTVGLLSVAPNTFAHSSREWVSPRPYSVPGARGPGWRPQ